MGRRHGSGREENKNQLEDGTEREREKESDHELECQGSDLDSAEEEMLASESVPSRLGFEHKGPDSVCLQTSLETGVPGDEASPPSTQLIRAGKPPWRADFAALVSESDPTKGESNTMLVPGSVLSTFGNEYEGPYSVEGSPQPSP
ncbi:hypothetical protein MRX96_058618 [Rhipicephalus microplus]